MKLGEKEEEKEKELIDDDGRQIVLVLGLTRRSFGAGAVKVVYCSGGEGGETERVGEREGRKKGTLKKMEVEDRFRLRRFCVRFFAFVLFWSYSYFKRYL